MFDFDTLAAILDEILFVLATSGGMMESSDEDEKRARMRQRSHGKRKGKRRRLDREEERKGICGKRRKSFEERVEIII